MDVPEQGRSKVVMITGATGAIGSAMVADLLSRPGFEVVAACRNEKKGQRLMASISRKNPAGAMRMELVDVSSKASIAEMRRRWVGPLHVLINNAVEAPRRRQETARGIERQFATNVLGYFWMMQAFKDVLSASAPARVVNVASYWAGGLDLNDLEFKTRPYDNDAAYRQSKQADRMLTVAVARRWQGTDVAVNACHSGDVNSQISNSLGFGGHESPEEGAETPLMLATGPQGHRQTGAYFEHGCLKTCRFAADLEAVEQLYQICREY